jgi:hypothetical protein
MFAQPPGHLLLPLPKITRAPSISSLCAASISASASRITSSSSEREFLALGPEQFARERLGNQTGQPTKPASSP